MSFEEASELGSACAGLHDRIAGSYHAEFALRERELCDRVQTDDVYKAALASYRKIVGDWDQAAEGELACAEQSARDLANSCRRAETAFRRAESAYVSAEPAGGKP